MLKRLLTTISLSAIAVTAVPAAAQEAGEVTVSASVARTKLADEGEVFSNGVLDPNAAYETRAAYHSVVSLEYFPIDNVALQASVSTPATTNNLPGGSLAGLPNLGDDEFVLATVGAAYYPFSGRVRPYVGGGLAVQLTTQERDGLAVGLDIPNAHGPYVNAGVRFSLSERFDLFADVRHAWYSTNATGLLPLDATFTTFAQVDANAVLDPLTIQIGIGTRFGGGGTRAEAPLRPRQAGDFLGRFGVTNLALADSVELNVGGAPLANAGLSTFEHQTISAQFTYFLTNQLAINATLGFPPTIDIMGAGAIGPLPTLGEVTYGPTALTLQWHPLPEGRVRPYVGVGLSYMIVFGTEDGAFNDLEVGNDLGFAFEAGVDMPINDRIGLFFDAKRALLRPVATGTFAGNAVTGHTRLDPWALSAGISLRF